MHANSQMVVLWVCIVATGVTGAVICACLYDSIGNAAHRYRAMYSSDAQSGFSEIFLFISSEHVWWVSVFCCVICALIIWLLTGMLVLSALSGALCMRVPRQLIARLRARRLLRLEAQLPNALRSMAAALRAGASLPVVLQHVSAHAGAPLSQELSLVQREQRMGVNFQDAMRHMERRLNSEAISLLTASLRVSSHAGGNLSVVLDSVALTVAGQVRMASRMRTLTSQGRLQAGIVGALPLLLLLALTLLAPADMAPLWQTPTGWLVLGFLGAMEIMGFVMIRRIVNVEC